ncbi:histidine phosphatase family protein [Cryobacterium sp. TMT1-21]|uniref:Histidine phosphatase family protein n=1 Tax=Cryobacterium shii TaxID=1259235 RepID=A0AAQ2HFK5_9MICO|nr:MULTISPECIES: histidine phosphatase family protein [Cryobacterium]TFC45613.1 histidine phosphatase family protein [Cryobacterium shii]TFC85779.1 histidine phosphatase family protein [Cryobacterium sp. TmT2-59]TFD16480.1 histidine phosphatase family protein [Cryobacterium sp. TMT1-21]TFD16928.1 histidine phosphatase family protein [Cryobacterium sp. TMT4-10]TFD23604.1 histidine phosphatase family protein [Cryobacterium sp. TMT2-23]
MVANQVHLVRHGEVFNLERVLYGRLPGYRLSDLGAQMAEAAAADLVERGRPVARIVSSPLQRTRESAAPIAAAFGLSIDIDERIIEPANVFEGKRMRGPDGALRDARNWPALRNPLRPSWGEPFESIVQRMLAAIEDARRSVDEGDVVLVSHQLPIWMVHRALARERLAHDPRKRRCDLSSITTLSWPGDRLVEAGYTNPALALQSGATDVGAV